MDSTTYVTIGSIAPDFRAPTSNGQTLDQASFLGNIGGEAPRALWEHLQVVIHNGHGT